MTSDDTLDIGEIQRLLPHRYPFQLIDRVKDIHGDQHGIGRPDDKRVVSFTQAPLAPTIAIAIASMASFGKANAVDRTDASEQIPDQIVSGFTAPSQVRVGN
jgi:3-hydroxymyristoyl/3-hydroxydecanoyl-(acyl carrier protein) dehydratase